MNFRVRPTLMSANRHCEAPASAVQMNSSTNTSSAGFGAAMIRGFFRSAAASAARISAIFELEPLITPGVPRNSVARKPVMTQVHIAA